MYPALKKSRWKPKRKALGSVYDLGGGLVGRFDASYVWGRYGGDYGSYEKGVVSDHRGKRVGMVRGRTLIHDLHGALAYCRDGDFVFPGGALAGRYTGDESGAAAAFLLHLHRNRQREAK
jgi:hypothetical protein